MITGESIPVMKREGDEVIGATMNTSGSFRFEATKVGEDTALYQIMRMVEEAQGLQGPHPAPRRPDKRGVRACGDRRGSRDVLGLAAARARPALTFALLNTVAVLIIACPCAMGLATPTSIMVGTGKGAESGILIRRGGPRGPTSSTRWCSTRPALLRGASPS